MVEEMDTAETGLGLTPLIVAGRPDIRSQVAIIIVTTDSMAVHDPGGYETLSYSWIVGHTAADGPHIRFNKLLVPKSSLLAPSGKRLMWSIWRSLP
jgi:hypothetical protein